jgi:hypothetical protein
MSEEITDVQIKHTIGMQVQSETGGWTLDPSIQYRVHRIWDSEIPNWYKIEITNNQNVVYSAMLDFERGKIYLDARSMMGLMLQSIYNSLSVYNAGHDPRFRGM